MRLAVSPKTILIGIAVVAVSFLISLKAMDWIAPRGGGPAPVLVELPPLSPVSKRSFVLAPEQGAAPGFAAPGFDALRASSRAHSRSLAQPPSADPLARLRYQFPPGLGGSGWAASAMT